MGAGIDRIRIGMRLAPPGRIRIWAAPTVMPATTKLTAQRLHCGRGIYRVVSVAIPCFPQVLRRGEDPSPLPPTRRERTLADEFTFLFRHELN